MIEAKKIQVKSVGSYFLEYLIATGKDSLRLLLYWLMG